MLHMYAFVTSHLAGLQTKRDERGATAVEYGLMVSLIAVAIIVAVTTLGTNLSEMFDSVAGKITNA
jgi:pilus assembly protein Flp/PilA